MNPATDIPGLNALVEQAHGGAPDIRIAVIDGPVDPSHPAFAGDSPEAHARLTVLSSQNDRTRSTHGTHIASVIAGQPGSPVTGIAPRCEILCIPVYREDSNGNLISCAQTTLARAIHHALDSGATLINISGGQFTPTGQGDRFLEAAVRECAQRNALIVAAAGNDGCRCLHVPAALPTVLAVGACDRNGKPMPFSYHGDAYRDNGILAPGDAIPGAGPDGTVGLRTGTSFATPIVTAVAALLLNLHRRLGGEVDAHAIRRLLLDTAAPLDPQLARDHGDGPASVLDVTSAMAALQRTAPSSTQQPPDSPTPSTSPLPSAAGGVLSASTPSNNQLTGEANAMSANYQTSGHAPAPILGPDGNPLSGVGPSTAEPSAGGQPLVAPSDANAAEATAVSATSEVSPAEAPGPEATPAPAATTVTPAAGPTMVPSQMAPLVQGVPLVMPQGFAPQMMVPQPVTPQPVTPQALAPQVVSDGSTTVPMGASPAAIAPSQSCDCVGVRPSQAMGESPVFVIGRLYYDFESEARFDYFVQAIAEWRKRVDPQHYNPAGDYAAPWNAEIMIRFLLSKDKQGVLINFPDSNALIWTLTIDTVPIYAIKPHHAFGLPMYLELVSLLWHQETAESFTEVDNVTGIGMGPKEPPKKEKKKPPITRVSQAGFVHGEVRLMNGTVIPQLMPVWRGMYGWNVDDLAGKSPPANFKEFLERIYNQFRNVGVSPQDRAMNYSAFNAYNTKKIFYEMAHHTPNPMFLDTVSVDRSTICRPDSDCWDTTWTFFDPTQTLTTARKVFQYTVDVSDVVPVSVGPLRDWMIF